MAKSIRLPQLAWHGAGEREFPLPGTWRVAMCDMAGHDRPALAPGAIKEAVGRPVGMPPLREYARGKKEVVIIFDDMARVTRVAEIVPHVLEELAAAGIDDRQVRFIAACGCHGAMTRADFEKKLGKEVLARFPVYNHAPYGNCVYAGTTKRGTELHINAEVMKCDLKIGIGSIVPHIMAGFGGGGKLVLPGVASYDTIVALHTPPKDAGGVGGTVTGMGNIEGNPRRRDIDEAAAIVGLDMKIDAIVNKIGDAVAIYAGVPALEFAAGLVEAKAHYLSPTARDRDIVIVNSYAKVNEAISGLQLAFPAIKPAGGSIVLIANAPEGQVTHYLMGAFGTTLGGKFYLQMKPPENVKRLIVFGEYPEVSMKRSMEDSERVILTDDWDGVLKMLEADFGAEAEVAVYPNADIQYCAG